MQIDRVPLDSLSPFDQNPRSIDSAGLDRLKASLRRFGLFAPLIVWPDPDRGLVVVGGNQRLTALRAMRESGEEVPAEVPVVVLDCTEADARVIVVRDNTHDGEWEWSALGEYLQDLVATDSALDLDLTGFESEVFDEIVALGTDPLIMATQPTEGGEDSAVGDGSGDGPRTGNQISKPDGAEQARFVLGNIRGKIPISIYGRFVGLFERRSTALATTDFGVVLGSLLDDLGGAK